MNYLRVSFNFKGTSAQRAPIYRFKARSKGKLDAKWSVGESRPERIAELGFLFNIGFRKLWWLILLIHASTPFLKNRAFSWIRITISL